MHAPPALACPLLLAVSGASVIPDDWKADAGLQGRLFWGGNGAACANGKVGGTRQLTELRNREIGNSGQIVGERPGLHRYTTAVGGRRERGVPPCLPAAKV